MRFVIIGSLLLSLFGCKSLMLSSNDLALNNNKVVAESIDLAVNINDDYKYLGQYEYQQFMNYSDSYGGSIHNGRVVVFENKESHSFIAIDKETCSRCVFFPSSRVSKEDGPASFFVGNKRVYKRNGSCFSMTPNNENDKKLIELLMSSNNSGVYDGRFCTSSYVYGVNNSHFQVMLVAPCNENKKLNKNINDVVTLLDD